MPTWSSWQYLRFESERSRPAAELIARIPLDDPGRVVDIGCGPGNSTELLVRRWPDATVTGFDTSPDMLQAARGRLPNVEFFAADAATWRAGSSDDVLFSNAVFQWVPRHLDVLVRLFEELKPGAVLAVQMPDNLREPSHIAMAEAAAEGRWADKLTAAGLSRDPLPPVEVYYDRLVPLSSQLDIWHTVYVHPMEGADGVIEWVRGTGLRPYLDALDEAERADFLAAYHRRIERAYPARTDGRSLLRYPRLFIVAVRR